MVFGNCGKRRNRIYNRALEQGGILGQVLLLLKQGALAEVKASYDENIVAGFLTKRNLITNGSVAIEHKWSSQTKSKSIFFFHQGISVEISFVGKQMIGYVYNRNQLPIPQESDPAYKAAVQILERIDEAENMVTALNPHKRVNAEKS